jgi:ferric-dicitrate binding protein FerR (iron transport regulator)
MIDNLLLKKYLEGTCSQEEADAVRRHLADGNADMEPLRTLLEASFAATQDEEMDAVAADRILAQLRQKLYDRPLPQTEEGIERPFRRRWYGAAAAVTLALVSGLLYFFHGRTAKPVATVAWKQYSNTGSAPSHIIMPDSTQVWLSANSTLYYNEDYGQEKRKLRLEGEAYFKVTKDAAHPCWVYAGNVVTQVLGTAFNIEAYQRESFVRVLLTEGKVAVCLNSDSLQRTAASRPLFPGQMLIYDRVSQDMSAMIAEVPEEEVWTTGGLVFNNILVTDALERLADRYHLQLVYNKRSKLYNKRITAVFRKEPLDRLLHNVLFLHNCTYKLKGNILEIM